LERSIPLWVVLLCTLFWLLFTVAFGWAVKSTLAGSERSGTLGKAAVAIASFPTLAKDVVSEMIGFASGDYKDEQIGVRREKGADYSGFTPPQMAPGINMESLLLRAAPGAVTPGWRVLSGAFQIDGDIENAVLLLSPDLEIVRKWVLEEIPVGEVEPRPKHRKFVHGVEMLPDGSVIFTFDGSISLQKFNACGAREWIAPGAYHHAVTLDDTGQTVWSFIDSGPDAKIAQVSVADGTVVRQISVTDIIAANPMTDILEIRKIHQNDISGNSRNTTGKWMFDPFHFNDVEPLPAAIADRFEGFEAGDLLISARSLNLVFVIDPETLEIRWWRAGAVQRQHDPDWLPNGQIMIFNNRMSRDFSEIVTIDPKTMARTVRLDGRDHDFYTRIRGKQQLLGNGTLQVTSPQQGRAFEVDRTGKVVLELVNTKPDSGDTNYVVSDLKWLPPDYFAKDAWTCETLN
jgi:hypothetical protein